METKKRVLVADASEEFRKLLADAIRQEADLEVAGVTGNGEELLELAQRCQPDVIVMDMERLWRSRRRPRAPTI